MRRPVLINIILFSVTIFIFFGMIYNKSYNDNMIIGVWKEKSWNYEKVDNFNGELNGLDLSDRIRSEVAKDIIIHKGEIWEFMPNNKLKIHIDGQDDVIVEYKFKGRGHILKIIHKGEVLEHYTIYKIDDRELVLNFYCETQARGIVKLTFEKVL